MKIVEHDIFSETQIEEDPEGEFDYGCCGDNLPLPAFAEDGTALPQKALKCVLPTRLQQDDTTQSNSSQPLVENSKHQVLQSLAAKPDQVDAQITIETPGLSWLYLMTLLLISVSSQMQRFLLAFSFGYMGKPGTV